MFLRNIILAFTASFFAINAFASGGSGFPRGNTPFGNSDRGSSFRSAPSAPRTVDQAYEYGKSLYFGRVKGKVISYCVALNSISSPVQRSSIRTVRGVSYSQLGELLHNCDNKKQVMSSILNKNQLNAVAYYLNKRYRLNLRRT